MESKTFQIAQSYAKSLFEASLEEGQYNKVQDQLFNVATELLENETFQSFAKTPHIPVMQKLETLERVLAKTRLNKLLRNFILSLIGNGRFDLMPAILVCFRKIQYVHEGVCKVTTSSVEPLSDEVKSLLGNVLKNSLKKPIEIKCILDKSLIGGLKIEFDKYIIDSSIQNKISRIKAVINSL
jgi:F-type H+-transporting ATPase subunit delta